MKRRTDRRAEAEAVVVSPELVERCKRGDEQAWAELVKATQRDVYTVCLRILRDPADAAEATQDAYLKVWRGLKGFRGDAMFSTWLYRIAANAAISKHRSRKRTRTHEEDIDEQGLSQIASGASTEAAATARLDVRDLEEALARLPEHYRVTVVLRDVYELSIEEIAKELKISQTAAKVRVHRGRKMLREAMWSEDR